MKFPIEIIFFFGGGCCDILQTIGAMWRGGLWQDDGAVCLLCVCVSFAGGSHDCNVDVGISQAESCFVI